MEGYKTLCIIFNVDLANQMIKIDKNIVRIKELKVMWVLIIDNYKSYLFLYAMWNIFGLCDDLHHTIFDDLLLLSL